MFHSKGVGFFPSLGNRAHPSGGKPLFADGDPRLQFIVSEVDPRIHFALVCGAKVPNTFSTTVLFSEFSISHL